MNEVNARPGQQKFLVGGGEMGEKIAALDWLKTPLGPIEAWPQSLKTSISLMLNSQHPMWIGWGKDATFFYNDAYVEVLSLAKHPWALGKPAAEVWSEIWEICGPIADKVFQKGEASFLNDVRLFMSRGDFLEETFYSFSYSPIRDESGNVGGLFCPSAEVTPKVLNARRLRTLSELAVESLIQKSAGQACAAAARILGKNPDDIPFAVFYLTDAEGKNSELEQAVGLAAGNEANHPAKVALNDPAGAARLWPIAEVVTHSRAAVTGIQGREGFPLGPAKQPVVEAVVLPLISRGQEQPLGVLIAGINPTRRLDAEYRTFFELVASHVATAIQNARATEQEKKRADTLAELDRAKTTFFGNVSHELRTPLTLILGPLEDEMRASPAPSERLELAHRNSLRLLKLVNTLLDFSRIESGRVDTSFEPVDLAKYTAELASVFRSLFEKAGLRLILNLQPIPEPVFVDRDMWEKIVFNLLSNAFKFTLEGEVEVKLQTADDAAGNGSDSNPAKHYVCLSVRDTGTGIPAAELPRIFERFHRVRNARSRSHEGTGIGLAFVQELARLHGGHATVESVEGRGTTFTIWIPTGSAHLAKNRIGVARTLEATSTGAAPFLEESRRWLPDDRTQADELALALAEAAGKPSAKPEKSDANPLAGQKPPPRILLADDNADMREYVRRLLSARGYDVVTVANGREALAVCQSQSPALVLSDVMMPELDGFGLLRELRKDAKTGSLPVILLSARAGEEARVEGVEAGADDYLTKPFSARELLARVATHLELSRIRQEGESRVRISQERLQRVLDGSNDGYWEWNVATGEIFMSPRWYELLGYEEADLERHVKIISELTHPDDLWMVRENVEAVIHRTAGKDSYEFESRLRTKSGGYKWLLVRGRVMRRDEAGVATLVTGAVTDISERKAIQARAALLSQLTDALSTLSDPEAINRVTTRAIGEFLGVQRCYFFEAMKDPELVRVLPDWRREGVASMEGVYNLRDFGVSQLWKQVKRGAVTINDVRTHPWTAEFQASYQAIKLAAFNEVPFIREGEWVACLAVASDRPRHWTPEEKGLLENAVARVWPLIERARTAAALQQANLQLAGKAVELESLVNQRTAKLQETVGELEAFSYSIAHDMRAPLRSLQGFSDILLEEYGGKLDQEGRQYLKRIAGAAMRLDKLIRDVLDYSRVVRAEYPMETVELEPLLREIIDTYPMLVPEKAEIELAGPFPAVLGNQAMLTQIFSNLMGNAVKFMPAGVKPRLKLWAEPHESRLRVFVQDNGIGIPEAQQKKIFEIFQQLDQNYEGTGIGLAIVKKAVERIGGKVGLKSEPGKGSTFWIELKPA